MTGELFPNLGEMLWFLRKANGPCSTVWKGNKMTWERFQDRDIHIISEVGNVDPSAWPYYEVSHDRTPVPAT